MGFGKKSLWKKGSLGALFTLAAAGATGAYHLHYEAQNDNGVTASAGRGTVCNDGGLLDRWHKLEAREKSLAANPLYAQELENFLTKIKNKSGANADYERLAKKVSKAVSRHVSYKTDKANYKCKEHWAAPTDTLLRHKGDCEDLAILKYHLLRKLGVPAENLHLALVSDPGEKIGHAVLVMNTGTAQNPHYIVLDNTNIISLAGSPYQYHGFINEDGYQRQAANNNNPLVQETRRLGLA